MKYKVIKDLPGLKKGATIEERGIGYYSDQSQDNNVLIDISVIESCPDYFELIPERIKMHLKESKYDILSGSGEYTFWINSDTLPLAELVPGDKKIDLMEKAINGELFTKEDLFSYTHKYMNMLPHNTNEDVFKAWIKNNKS